MFARLLAIVCLIVGPRIGWSEPVGPAPRKVVVYLSGSGPMETGQTHAFRQELQRLMASANYVAELTTSVQEVEASHLVVLKLDGACDTSAPPADIPAGANPNLATSAVVDGHVLPFTTVHCGVLSRMLAAANHGSIPSQLYGRSLGRIVAHELYHILADEVGHQDTGVSKACFRLSDLLDDKFAFQAAAVRKLRPAPTYVSQVAAQSAHRNAN